MQQKFGYSAAEYTLFKKHAWRFLLLFSFMYCAHYCTRLNLSNASALMMDELNWNQLKADKVIEYLCVEGYIYRKNSRYFRTDREWTCDMKRARIVSGFRWRELREFNRFIDSKECYMKQIRNALDDATSERCGKCSNCIGKHFFE